MTFTVILFCIIYAILNVTGTGLIKHELSVFHPHNFSEYVVFFLKLKVILGLLLNFLSVIATVKALSLAKFSYVVPIAVGINFLLTVIAGCLIFKDNLSVLSFTGIFLILIGILFMNL